MRVGTPTRWRAERITAPATELVDQSPLDVPFTDESDRERTLDLAAVPAPV